MLLTIDHVGIACRNLDAAIERYVSVFGLAVVSQETNTEQGVREAMLATESGTSYVQLLQPLSPDTPVGKFLEKRGEGMHHVGYAVADVSAARKVLHFAPAHSDLTTIIRTAWAWHQQAHPRKAA